MIAAGEVASTILRLRLLQSSSISQVASLEAEPQDEPEEVAVENEGAMGGSFTADFLRSVYTFSGNVGYLFAVGHKFRFGGGTSLKIANATAIADPLTRAFDPQWSTASFGKGLSSLYLRAEYTPELAKKNPDSAKKDDAPLYGTVSTDVGIVQTGYIEGTPSPVSKGVLVKYAVSALGGELSATTNGGTQVSGLDFDLHEPPGDRGRIYGINLQWTPAWNDWIKVPLGFQRTWGELKGQNTGGWAHIVGAGVFSKKYLCVSEDGKTERAVAKEDKCNELAKESAEEIISYDVTATWTRLSYGNPQSIWTLAAESGPWAGFKFSGSTQYTDVKHPATISLPVEEEAGETEQPGLGGPAPSPEGIPASSPTTVTQDFGINALVLSAGVQYGWLGLDIQHARYTLFPQEVTSNPTSAVVSVKFKL